VVSDIWLGGNLIAHTGERNLAVLVDGRRFKSPWVRQDALSACGALVLDQLSDGHGATEEPDPALQAMFEQAVDTGIWELPWDSPAAPGDSPRGMVRWGVILPAHDQGCLNASK
jgi:hypothetical protein